MAFIFFSYWRKSSNNKGKKTIVVVCRQLYEAWRKTNSGHQTKFISISGDFYQLCVVSIIPEYLPILLTRCKLENREPLRTRDGLDFFSGKTFNFSITINVMQGTSFPVSARPRPWEQSKETAGKLYSQPQVWVRSTTTTTQMFEASFGFVNPSLNFRSNDFVVRVKILTVYRISRGMNVLWECRDPVMSGRSSGQIWYKVHGTAWQISNIKPLPGWYFMLIWFIKILENLFKKSFLLDIVIKRQMQAASYHF